MHTKYFRLLFGSGKIPSVSHLNSRFRSGVDDELELDDDDDDDDEESNADESDDIDPSVSTI